MRGTSRSGAARRPRKQALFLAALTDTVNVTLACRRAGIPRRTAYDWRDADEAFARQWDEALDEGIDLLEAELHRRAFEGVERPVYYKGEQVGTWRFYSDALAMFLLRAHRPERYRGSSPRRGADDTQVKDCIPKEAAADEDAQAYRAMLEWVWAQGREEQDRAAAAAEQAPRPYPSPPVPGDWDG